MLSPIRRPAHGRSEPSRVRHLRVVQGDSLLVLDIERLTLFAPLGSPARQDTLPAEIRAFRFAVLSSGIVLVNNYFPSHPSFVLLNRRYALGREFGNRPPAASPEDSDALQYAVAKLDGARFVAVPRNYRFAVEVWDTSGTLVRRFDPSATWFPPWSEGDKYERGPRSPPLPRIESISIDQRQRLWVAAAVPDPAWKDPLPRVRQERGREIIADPMRVSEYNRFHDTIISVLDLETGRVLISQRFDAYVPKFMEGGLMYSFAEGEGGRLYIDVWRASLERVR